MDKTHHCPMPNCSGNLRESTDRYGRWFCDECWFTLPRNFFDMEQSRAESILRERVAKYRKKIVADRRAEIIHAIDALRRKDSADDDPEIARILGPILEHLKTRHV